MKNSRGVTLIEVLISIAVIGIAFASIYLSFVYGIKTNIKAKNLTLSNQIVNKEMESVHQIPFSDLVNQTDGAFYLDLSTDLSKLNDGHGYLTIRNFGSDTKVKEIIVEVTWTEDAITKTTTAATLVTDGGINQ
jgi:prepilin-type N-terminal cleavage/methylation domain-containing protein